MFVHIWPGRVVGHKHVGRKSMTIRGLVGEAPTKNQEMLNWIEEAVELFQPESVVFCDGSE